MEDGGDVTTPGANISSDTSGKCTLFDDPHQCDVIINVKRAVACISFVACIFMIFVIWLFKKYKAFTQRLILYLSIASFMDSIAYIMSDYYSDGALCDFQAFWMTWFDWVCLLWVCCITINLGLLAIKMKKTEKYEWLYHVVCWIVPLIISCIPFAGDHYGPAGAWCWLVEWKWRFGIWYVPLFLIIFLLFVAYIYIVVVVNRRVHTYEGTYDPDVEQTKILMKEDIKPLRGYPFVYLAVSIFPLVNRIQNAINHQPVFVLYLLHIISSPLHGAMNAIVFGMDKETMKRLTPSQIKLALRSRREGATLIREYPVQAEAEGDSHADMSDVRPEIQEK